MCAGLAGTASNSTCGACSALQLRHDCATGVGWLHVARGKGQGLGYIAFPGTLQFKFAAQQ